MNVSGYVALVCYRFLAKSRNNECKSSSVLLQYCTLQYCTIIAAKLCKKANLIAICEFAAFWEVVFYNKNTDSN
jgi:hypothetical protein